MALAKTRRFACIVALGCVIRGDTPHFDYVASEAASGLQLAAIETGVPVAFGVLTLERPDQAEPRIAKGAEAVAHRARDGRPLREPPRRRRAVILLAKQDSRGSRIPRLDPRLRRGRPLKARRGRGAGASGPDAGSSSYTSTAACPGSAPSAGSSPARGTPARTRWSPRSGASSRTSSACGSCSTASRPGTTCAPAASRPARSTKAVSTVVARGGGAGPLGRMPRPRPPRPRA